MTPSFLTKSRSLESNDEEFQSYLVDSSGNAYEPYSLAWRYLGMYIDCDVDQTAEEEENEASGDQRKRDLESGDDNDCSRKVLWAAYHDPRYRGGSIGEYKFYDWESNRWDSSTCQKRRCARMDCHEPRTHWKLIGVFKETDGLYDWGEQLFKHQGYCLWNGDKEDDGEDQNGGDDDEDGPYDFMQNQLEKWVSGCTAMDLSDSNGNSLYMDTKPYAEGNMTFGMYYDEYCTQEAQTNFSEYVIMFYSTYYYSEEQGEEAAAYWESSFDRWNTLMNTYKVCQPCRAYNRVPTNEENDEDDRRRFLENNENDGEGEEEQWGYNCYDDAGYRNCNQCYKFETKTDMEVATTEDLQKASAQGSILAIKVDGKLYGKGGFVSEAEPLTKALYFIALAGLILLGGVMLIRKKSQILKFVNFLRSRRQKFALPPSFRETLSIGAEESVGGADAEAELQKKDKLLQKQQEEIVRLQHELDQERSKRQLEQSSANDDVKELEQQHSNVNPAEPPQKAAEQTDALKQTDIKGRLC